MMKVGLSSCNKEITEQLFENYKRAGIDAIEFSLTPEQCKDFDYPMAARYAKKYGIEMWSYHLPFVPFDQIELSVTDQKLRKQTIAWLSELIRRGSDVGIDKFVVHPSGEPIKDEERPERMKCAKESLAALAGVAISCGSVIAVEDLPRTCLGRNSDEILELIDADPALRVCFDTNHLLGEPITDFIHKVGDKIITTHISDYDFIDERHWMPGEGKINWNQVIDAFEEVGYDAMWLYELGFRCPKTIMRERNFTCEDFARNAKEIFERKVPTTFCTYINLK